MAEPIGVGSAIFNESRNWIMPRVRSNCHQPQSATCFGGFRANILSKINLIGYIPRSFYQRRCGYSPYSHPTLPACTSSTSSQPPLFRRHSFTVPKPLPQFHSLVWRL